MELKPCGTDAAYQRHLYYGEEACAACRAAHRQRDKDAAQARLASGDLDHGTYAAYVLAACRCAECRRANTEHWRDLRDRKRHNLALIRDGGPAVRLAVLAPPGEWVDEALCAQVDPELWFPERGGPATTAKRICMRCPVRVQCLDYATSVETADHTTHGVWGAMSARERETLRRRRERRAG